MLIGFALGYRGYVLIYLAIISFTTALIQLLQYYRSIFQGYQLFKIDAFASNFDKFFLAIILTALLLTTITVDSFIYARLVSVVLAIIVLQRILARKKLFSRPVLSFRKTIPILKKSFPFALITIFYSVHERVDQVMLERIHPNGEEVTGIYAASYRWLDLTMMYLWIVLPMFFAKLSFHKTSLEDKNTLIKVGVSITSLPLILISGFGIFHGEKLFILFTHSSLEQIELMTQCVKILFICLLIHGFCAILSTYLTSNGYTSFINLMMVISILVNVGLNIYLIPIYGATAAAWTTLISTLTACIGYILYIQLKTPLNLPYAQWGKLILVSTIYFSGLFTFQYYNIHWIAGTSVSLLFSMLTAWQLDLINFRKLKGL